MTHAEAASKRDVRVMYDNYGPMIWGGTGELWDLLQLEKGFEAAVLVVLQAVLGLLLGHAAHHSEAEDVPSLWLLLVGLLNLFGLSLELMFWKLLQLEEGCSELIEEWSLHGAKAG